MSNYSRAKAGNLDPRWYDMGDPITQGAHRCDEVVDGLSVGGGWCSAHWFGAVCLCTAEREPEIADGTEVYRCELRDSEPTPEELERAGEAAEWVVRMLQRGDRVLVTCLGGLNRSGLVVGLALRTLGYDAEEAIRLVRDARGQFALSNKHFVETIRN